MSLFTDSQDLDAYGHKLAQMLLIGGYQLESRTDQGKRIQFDTWSQAVRTEAGKRGIEVSADQLRWLWDSLKTEPATRAELSHLMVDGTDIAPVKVLPKGSRFSIHLGNITTGHGSSSSWPNARTKPEAEVVIDDELYMARGKKNHLECKPVLSSLIMMIYSDVEGEVAEAAKMKAKPATVSIEGNRVTVKVGSLNQAYTKASLRLEPERQSHGGRTYDALFWIDSQGNKVSLGKIRDDVECGRWTLPRLPVSNDQESDGK